MPTRARAWHPGARPRGRGLALALLLLAALPQLAGCGDARLAFDGGPWLARLDRAVAAGTASDESRMAYDLALAAQRAAAGVAAYTARFEKQERLAGELRPVEQIDARVREAPLSVHLRWVGGAAAGKEALYVEDDNDDRVRVRMGHLPAPVTLNLEPDGALALGDSRHPITHMGLRMLARGLLQHRGETSPAPPEAFRLLGRTRLDGRAVDVIGRRVADRADRPADTLIYGIDAGTGLAVFVGRYEPADPAGHGNGRRRLLEFYRYRRIDLEADLSDADFDFARLGS
jgi:hypothetical protein